MSQVFLALEFYDNFFSEETQKLLEEAPMPENFAFRKLDENSPMITHLLPIPSLKNDYKNHVFALAIVFVKKIETLR